MGPAEEEDAELAVGAATSLPGRKALQTPFQAGAAVRRPGLCARARGAGPLGPLVHSPGLRVVSMQVQVELSNWSYEPFASHSDDSKARSD